MQKIGFLAISGLALLGACASVDGGASAGGLTLAVLADDLAEKDVVFLGEEHDNAVGHMQQAQILRLLHERRPELVLTMEMFERDVQQQLDDYLAGAIDEDEFLESSRPWPGYAQRYRPMVEYCKRHELPVIAANIPRALAREVSGRGLEAAANEPHAARNASAPRDEYWERFKEAMSGHQGVTDETMFRYYESQCVKDDTMAESITDYLGGLTVKEPRPLVVHVCGQFHCEDRLGTAARVMWRMPDLEIAVVRMDVRANISRDGEDYVLRVPGQPEFAKKAKPDAVPDVDGAADDEDEDDAGSRPALGFMPGYDDAVDGVLVEALRPDGPSARAGLEVGDIIVRVGEADVPDLNAYLEALGSLEVGSTVQVTVDRGGKTREFDVKVGRRVN